MEGRCGKFMSHRNSTHTDVHIIYIYTRIHYTAKIVIIDDKFMVKGSLDEKLPSYEVLKMLRE